MNEIKIQVYANRKLSKKVVDIGNMQENEVTKLVFELEEDIVALGGNVYLFVSYDGESYPYPLKDNALVIGRELTQRKKTETNIVVSTSNDPENPLNDVVWISNTLTLTVDKNNINIDSINEEELPPSLKIIYDDLLNLEKDLQEKKDSDYWRGPQGPKGDAGSVKFVVVKELPTENIEANVMYLLQIESEEENNKFLEYIYVDGAWENVGSASVEVDLTDYVKKDEYATPNNAGIVKIEANNGIGSNNGLLYINPAYANNIDERKSHRLPIVPYMLDYAVMKALTDPINHEWTDEQKELARTLLDAVGSTDYATTEKAGLVKINNASGIRIDGNNALYIDGANDNEIANKTAVNAALKPNNIDKIVKSGLAYSLLDWTDEEKASALELLGAMSNKKPNGRNYGDGTVIGFSTNGKLTYQNVFGKYIESYSIPIRDSNGVLYANAPTEDNGLTTKKYVDDLVSQHDIITNASGKVVAITDSAKAKPNNIKLFGKGKQETVPGNQLLDLTDGNSTTTTDGTTVFTNLGNGIYSRKSTSGVVNLYGNAWFKGNWNVIPNEDNSNVILTLEVGQKYSIVDCYLCTVDSTGNAKGITGTITIEDEPFKVTGVRCGELTVGEIYDDIIYPMVNKDEPLPWEPFVGGEQSPNMKYPQKVECLGESGSIVGKVLRKNFLPNNATNKTENGVTFTVNSDKSITIYGTPTAETYLYLVTTSDTRTLQKGKYVFTGGKDRVYATMYTPKWSEIAKCMNNVETEIELLEDTEYFCYITVIKDVFYNTRIYPMIRPYGTDNTYESHNEDEQPFIALTPNGLRGIPLGQTIPNAIANSPIHMSGVYWDSVEGQYYIADTENEDGKDVQRIWKYTLIEDDKQYIDMATASSGNSFQIKPAILNKLPSIINCNDGTIVMSNVATGISYNQRGNKEFVSVFCGDGNGLYLRDSIKNTLTIEEVRNADITIWYVMADPIITDRTTEETESFNALLMNYPNTTIVNDAGAYMEVEYVADTQKHIEQNYVPRDEFEEIKNQIADIQEQMVNNE